MEQDQLLRRNQPLSAGGLADPALLIAAHGERQSGAGNDSVQRIARLLAARGMFSEVTVGFINGAPGITEALRTLTARRIVIYPLFAANGYFSRDRLVQLIDEASLPDRRIDILSPLGLDPGLPDVVLNRAGQVACENGFVAKRCAVVLLAHGSRRNPASREVTEQLASELGRHRVWRTVHVAFLEEEPGLDKVIRSIDGPVIVVGMFSGEGLHGARDAPRLIAQVGRRDVVYAGVIARAPGIDDIIVHAVQQAL